MILFSIGVFIVLIFVLLTHHIFSNDEAERIENNPLILPTAKVIPSHYEKYDSGGPLTYSHLVSMTQDSTIATTLFVDNRGETNLRI